MIKNKNQYWGSNYIFYEGAIYLGTLPYTDLHRFHYLAVSVGNKKPINLRTENGFYQAYTFIIGPDVLHTGIDYEEEGIAILLSPESELAQKIAEKYLKDNNFMSPQIKRDIQAINRYFSEPSIENAVEIYHSVIDSLELPDTGNSQKDYRIINAINYIQNLEVKKASTKEIAEHVGLSEGRLTHLFKEQVGIPIRRYLQWYRLIDAMGALCKGKSLTYAAHEAEFADYAHLSRCFTETHGYSISAGFKNIKVIIVEPFLRIPQKM